jgi:hypothetical protein
VSCWFESLYQFLIRDRTTSHRVFVVVVFQHTNMHTLKDLLLFRYEFGSMVSHCIYNLPKKFRVVMFKRFRGSVIASVIFLKQLKNTEHPSFLVWNKISFLKYSP